METNTLQYGIVRWSGPVQPTTAQLDAIKRCVERVAPALAGMEWRNEGYSPTSLVSITARRANLANLGREARATLRFGSVDDISLADVRSWTRAVVDVLDTTIGDVVIDATSPVLLADMDMDVCCNQMVQEASPIAMPPAAMRGIIARKASKCNEMRTAEPKQARTPALDAQEDEQIAAIDRQQQRALDELQTAIINYIATYHADPRELLLKLQGKVIVSDQVSPLVVNQDMDIVLPYYNEIVVEMPAMCKAIYILFLLHPQGIVLKHFGDLRGELEQVYGIVMPNRNEALARESIDNLCSPLSNTLNEYIAKIKRSFRRYVLNDRLLQQYVIVGRRGQPYHVALPPEQVTLPAVFR